MNKQAIRGLSAGVCPSVRLSVCHVRFCIQTTKDIVKLLSRPGSIIILVFETKRRYPTAIRETPSVRGVKYTEVGKISDLRLKSPFTSKVVNMEP